MKKLMCAAAFVFALVVSGGASADEASTWPTFCPKGEEFSISFPSSTPAAQTKSLRTPAGVLRVTMYADQDNAVGYALGVLEIPAGMQEMTAEDPEAALEGVALGFVKSAKGTVISQKKVKLGDHQAQEVKASVFGGEGTVRCRAILTKDRIYLVVVVAPAGEDISPDTDAFFRSFKLKEALVEFDPKQL